MLARVITAWVEFGFLVILIGIAGSRLSRYGDVIAEKLALSRSWIGVVLLATVTSLPELVNGISSVTLADAPDIAVGDVLGSCIFNLTLLVILDFLHREESIYRRASAGHILSGGFGILLLGFVGFSLLLADAGANVAVGWIGLSSPIIAALYVLAMRSVFYFEKRERADFAEAQAKLYPHLALRQAAVRYAAASLVVVAAGVWLPFVGTELATVMGWHASFVGTLFVALATSVPETAVTVAALRLGALDLAIGNLFGSNLFNVVILAVDDAFYTEGRLLEAVSPVHAISAFSAIMMTAIAILGLFYRPSGRVLGRLGWNSLFLFSAYVLNTLVLFFLG